MENENKENNQNPFANGETEKIKEEITQDVEKISSPSEENNSENHEDTVAVENSKVPNENSTEEKNSEEKGTEEKKGIFDGLFGKKTEDELKKVQEKYETLNNQYLRLAADFDNYRKRQQSERENLIKYGSEQVLKKMLEVVDNFARAEKSMDKIVECEKAKDSFYILYKQFTESLTKLGLEEIKAEGETFNPNIHEAVMQVPADEEHPEDTVVQEMQKGYMYGEKVLRPAMVSVAVGS
jgi:molecular chaperone GrpE